MKENKKWYNFFGEKPTVKDLPKTKVYNFNTDSPFADVKYDYSNPYVNEFATGQYIPFGIDNLYPYILLDMYKSSPFHAALCEFKARAIVAGGLEIIVEGDTLESKLTKIKIETLFNRDFIKRFALEYVIHSRNVIKLIYSDDNRVTPEIVGAEKLRNSTKNDPIKYWLSSDWRRRKYDAIQVNEYNKSDKKNKIQMKVYQSLSPGVEEYAVPSYATAANWIFLDGQIGYFQKQNLENSINPSAIINFYERPGSIDETDEFLTSLQRSYAGAKNGGKIMTFFSDGKDLAPDIKIAEPNKLDKSFAATQENIIRNVSYSHNVNPVLMGISTAGSLGSSDELEVSYKLFKTIWLEPSQDSIEDYLNDILKIIGYNNVKVLIKRKETYIS